MTCGLHVESIGAGPPLVLLHGWAMHSGLWAAPIARLAAAWRVHAVDLPGHGYSGSVAPYTLDSLAETVASRFDFEREPVAVVGWSLGGLLALHWAHARPERVARLVLIATTPSFVARDGWPHAMAQSTLARFGDELQISYRLTLLRFLSLQLAGTADGKAALRALRGDAFARGHPSPAVLAAALMILAQTDLRAEVPSIGQPTLVVAGDRDLLAPLAASAWIAAALPQARLATILGAGHVPFLSHPAAFAAAFCEFLDER